MALAASSRADTLQDVIRSYESRGYRGIFSVKPHGQLLCHTCSAVTAAARTLMRALHRLEGASDPSDESAVAAIVCTACTTKGILVLAFGPEAALEDKLVFADLVDKRGTDPSLAPGQ